MANAFYAKGKQHILQGDINWLTDAIKMVLVDQADYTPVVATHEFLSDIPIAAQVAISPAFSGKTATDGVAGSSDVVILGVTGDEFEYVVVFKDTGDAATSPLICIYDTAYGMPFTPTGGSITVAFTSATKVFKL